MGRTLNSVAELLQHCGGAGRPSPDAVGTMILYMKSEGGTYILRPYADRQFEAFRAYLKVAISSHFGTARVVFEDIYSGSLEQTDAPLHVAYWPRGFPPEGPNRVAVPPPVPPDSLPAAVAKRA